ncbi:hypothetical protein C8R47DRAFT_1089953, partial [Mycena vitilis]
MLAQDAFLPPAAGNPALDSSDPAVIPDATSTDISPNMLDLSMPIFVPSPSTATLLAQDVALLAPAADDLSSQRTVNLDVTSTDLSLKPLNPAVPKFVPSFRSAQAPLSHDTAAASTAHSKISWTRGEEHTRMAAPRPAAFTAFVPEFVPRARLVPGTTIPGPPGETHYQLTPHRSAAPTFWSSRSSSGGPLSIVSP